MAASWLVKFYFFIIIIFLTQAFASQGEKGKKNGQLLENTLIYKIYISGNAQKVKRKEKL